MASWTGKENSNSENLCLFLVKVKKWICFDRNILSPSFNFEFDFVWAVTKLSLITLSIRTSTLEPLAFLPKNLALKTAVSFITKTSLGSNNCGRSMKYLSIISFLRTNNLLWLRSFKGNEAISSSGSWKL